MLATGTRYVMSNDLLNAAYRFSILEQRLLIVLLDKFDPRQKIPQGWSLLVSARDMERLFPKAYRRNGNAHRDLKIAFERLYDREIFMSPEDSEKGLGVRVIDSYCYSECEDHPTGSYLVDLSNQIKRHISFLRKNFTKIHTWGALEFQSTYSYRLYELLSSRQKLGYWDTTHSG